MQNTAISCSVCGEGGHRVSSCPTLREPLKEGFYSGGGGGGHHSHEEDEAISGREYKGTSYLVCHQWVGRDIWSPVILKRVICHS